MIFVVGIIGGLMCLGFLGEALGNHFDWKIVTKKPSWQPGLGRK